MAKTVTLGEEPVRLPAFKVFKATEVGALLAEIMEEYPQLWDRAAEFRREYADKHATVIDKSTAEWEYPDRVKTIPADAWGDDGKIRIPGEPSGEEVFMAVFPDAYRLARRKILLLLALVVTPDAKLEEADMDGSPVYPENGKMDGAAISDAYRLIAHKAELQQIVGLALASKDVLAEQFAEVSDEHKEALGKLLDLLPFGDRQQPSSDGEPSSTDSPAPTPAGRAKKSSTASRGAKRSSSSTS